MNSIEKILESTLGDYDKHLVAGSLLYIFRGINSSQFNSLLDNYTGVSADKLAVRNALTNSGYLMKNIKFFLYALIKSGVSKKSRHLIKSYAQSFHVKDEDLTLTTCFTLEVLDTTLLQVLLKYKGKYACLTLNKIDKIMSELLVCQQMQTYLMKFFHRKLRFTLTTFGITRDDLLMDLKVYAVKQVYFMYPLIDSKLHCFNIMKSVMRQRGHNLIKEATTSKRAVLLEGADGLSYSNTLHSSDITIPDEHLSTGIIGNDRDIDLAIAVTQVIEKYKKPKQQRFLSLIMGTYDESFTEYLRGNRLMRSPTACNDDIADKDPTYLFKVCDFLDIKVSSANNLLVKIRQDLGLPDVVQQPLNLGVRGCTPLFISR